jgi:hypothetical protein
MLLPKIIMNEDFENITISKLEHQMYQFDKSIMYARE